MNQIVYFTFSGFIQILMYGQFGQQSPTLSATTLSLQLLELSGNGGVPRCGLMLPNPTLNKGRMLVQSLTKDIIMIRYWVVAIDGGARLQQTALGSVVGCREAGNVAHGNGGIRQSGCEPSSCVEVDSEDHCPWEEGGSADDICANEGTSTDEGARDAGEEAQGGCRVETARVAGGRLCHRRWSLPAQVPRPVGGRCMPNS
ncbi:hypothetical protein ACOMHN_030732 [Nucella lapillus]